MERTGSGRTRPGAAGAVTYDVRGGGRPWFAVTAIPGLVHSAISAYWMLGDTWLSPAQ